MEAFSLSTHPGWGDMHPGVPCRVSFVMDGSLGSPVFASNDLVMEPWTTAEVETQPPAPPPQSHGHDRYLRVEVSNKASIRTKGSRLDGEDTKVLSQKLSEKRSSVVPIPSPPRKIQPTRAEEDLSVEYEGIPLRERVPDPLSKGTGAIGGLVRPLVFSIVRSSIP